MCFHGDAGGPAVAAMENPNPSRFEHLNLFAVVNICGPLGRRFCNRQSQEQKRRLTR